MVAITSVFFQSDTCSDEALSFRSIPRSGPLTNGPDVALHDRTVAVLASLAYVSMDNSSPVVAVGLIMNPLQLVVATNEDNPTETMLKHLKTICCKLKKTSDTKFPHKLSHVNLREVSPKPDLTDVRLEALCNDLFLKIYKYSYGRWKKKHLKRWKVVEAFRDQLQLWKNADQETERDKIEHKQIFISHFIDFWEPPLTCKIVYIKLVDLSAKLIATRWEL